MLKTQNIYRRGAIYYYRKEVFLDPQVKINLRLSLNTAQQCLARKVANYLSVFIEGFKMITLKGRGNFLTAEQKEEAFKAV